MPKSKIDKLVKTLKKVQHAYYNAIPIMSDAEYDALYDELKDLDPSNPILQHVGAPVPADSRLQKVKHEIPMGSQNKINEKPEFVKWAEKTGAKRFLLQEKLDGLSIEVIYKKGKFTQAITRGGGEEGEDVTHTVKLMHNVPKTLPNCVSCSLRGEVIFPLPSFVDYESFPFDPPEKKYKNTRNAASGITRKKTPSQAATYLTVKYFDAVADHVDFEKESHKIAFIANQKLEHVETHLVSIDNAVRWYDHYATEKREQLDHEIDGLVIKVNNIQLQEALGETNGRPKGQVAWKFAAEMRKTTFKHARWDVGLTGRITPVAVLEPVHLCGVTVTYASLHNVAQMKRLGIYDGAEVLVSRRGGVIPAVEAAIEPDFDKDVDYPKECPVCKEPTGFEGEYLMCASYDCPAKKAGDIKTWVKKLEIDQVGDAFIDAALQAGIIKDPADLYTLSTNTIMALDGYQIKSAKTIIRNINKSRKLPIHRFLGALNIPGASTSTFESLVKEGFDDIDTYLNPDTTSFEGLPGIGSITAAAIADGLYVKARLIKKLLKNGVEIKKKIQGKLTGQSFCFTGQISISRPSAHRLVESMGGDIKTSVSKGLTYLIQSSATSTSGKTQKACKYGTKVLGEKDFFAMIDFSFKKLRDLT